MAETMADLRPVRPGAEHSSIRDWPGWDYALGIAFLLVGILALVEPPIASFATAIYLGFMLCVAGGFAFAAGIAGIGHRGGWLGILFGFLSFATGALVLYNPVAGAVSLVWVGGAWFILGGIIEIIMGFGMPVGRGSLILVGIINLVLGTLIVMMQPAQAFALLGYFVGISFVFRGLWSLLFTAGLRKIRQYTFGTPEDDGGHNRGL
jgi:uncharacterized membrane protein HdeD (DUF308 family)